MLSGRPSGGCQMGRSVGNSVGDRRDCDLRPSETSSEPRREGRSVGEARPKSGVVGAGGSVGRYRCNALLPRHQRQYVSRWTLICRRRLPFQSSRHAGGARSWWAAPTTRARTPGYSRSCSRTAPCRGWSCTRRAPSERVQGRQPLARTPWRRTPNSPQSRREVPPERCEGRASRGHN